MPIEIGYTGTEYFLKIHEHMAGFVLVCLVVFMVRSMLKRPMKNEPDYSDGIYAYKVHFTWKDSDGGYYNDTRVFCDEDIIIADEQKSIKLRYWSHQFGNSRGFDATAWQTLSADLLGRPKPANKNLRRAA